MCGRRRPLLLVAPLLSDPCLYLRLTTRALPKRRGRRRQSRGGREQLQVEIPRHLRARAIVKICLLLVAERRQGEDAATTIPPSRIVARLVIRLRSPVRRGGGERGAAKEGITSNRSESLWKEDGGEGSAAVESSRRVNGGHSGRSRVESRSYSRRKCRASRPRSPFQLPDVVLCVAWADRA